MSIIDNIKYGNKNISNKKIRDIIIKYDLTIMGTNLLKYFLALMVTD